MNKNTTKQNESQALLFSFNKSIAADFKGGRISSDGGLVLLREFDKKISFIKGLDGRIKDPRNPLFVIHEQEELLRQRIFQIALGYEDADDSDILRHDPLFQLAVKNKEGRKALFEIEELASQPTISRLENRVMEDEIAGINNFLSDNYIKTREKPPKEIVLDIDSTDDPTHGNQQLSMFHGYYGLTIYHPLLITELTSKLLLGAFLRAGNVHTADHVLEHLSPIVKKLKDKFPETKIVLREDSGFSSPSMYDYCKKENLSFVIGVPTNKVLEKKVKPYLAKAERLFEKGDQSPIQLYVSFKYKAESWNRQQKIVAKIEINKHSTDIRYVAASLKGKAKEIYEFYTKRGECENRIEELKNGFKADRLSCHNFYANYFRLLLHACACNFISLLRSNLKNTELAEAKIDTLRIKLFKVGAWVNETVRKIWVRFSSSWPFRDLFNQTYRAIAKSPHYSLS